MSIQLPVDHVVTEEEAPFFYDGKCYEAGDIVKMRPFDKAMKADVEYPPGERDGCWPDYCDIKGAFPHLKNSNQYVIAPGAVALIEIPTKLCGKPSRVYFNWCGSCFSVDFDKDPATAEVTDLQAPILNPRFLYIGAHPDTGECPSVIHVLNKGTAEMCLTASFYC